MDEVIKQLASPAFWILVVTVGIILNVSSGYVKTWMDRRLERYSEKRRSRNQDQKDLTLETIMKFKMDRHLQLVELSKVAIDFGTTVMMVAVVTFLAVLYQGLFSVLESGFPVNGNALLFGKILWMMVLAFLGALVSLAGTRAMQRRAFVRHCVDRANAQMMAEKNRKQKPMGGMPT